MKEKSAGNSLGAIVVVLEHLVAGAHLDRHGVTHAQAQLERGLSELVANLREGYTVSEEYAS